MINKNEIIKKIKSLLKHKNSSNLSIREISKEVGISTGTFYNLFKDKNELLIEMRKYEIEQSNLYISTLVDEEKDYLFIPAIRLTLIFENLVDHEILFETMNSAKVNLSMKESKMANIILSLKKAFKDYTTAYANEDFVHREILISGMLDNVFESYLDGIDMNIETMIDLCIRNVYRMFDVPENKIDYVINNYQKYLKSDD